MSRKSAYALKARDPAFASAWIAAMNAGARRRRQGDKVDEVHGPPVSLSQVHTSRSRFDLEREFADIVAELRDSAPLAPCPPAQ